MQPDSQDHKMRHKGAPWNVMIWKPPFFWSWMMEDEQNENGTTYPDPGYMDSENCSKWDEDPTTWMNGAERVGYLYVVPVICAVGFMLNVLTFVVLMDRHFHKMTFLMLKALALADATTLIITLPFGPTLCYSCSQTTTGLAKLVYHVYIYPSISNLTETISAWMTLALGFERLHAMRFWSVQGGVSLSALRVRLIILVVVLSAFIINLPYLFSVKITECYSQSVTEFGKSQGFAVYSWIRASLVQFIPLVVLCVLNVILLVWMSQWTRGTTSAQAWSTANRRQKAHRRLTAMLLGTIILFIMSNIPVAFAYLPIFCSIVNINAKGTVENYLTYRVITHSLALTAYSLDFVVYCLSNSHFRFTALDIFCDQCHSRKRVQPSLSMNEGAKMSPCEPTANDFSDPKSSSPVPPDTTYIVDGDSPVPVRDNILPGTIPFTRKVGPILNMNRY